MALTEVALPACFVNAYRQFHDQARRGRYLSTLIGGSVVGSAATAHSDRDVKGIVDEGYPARISTNRSSATSHRISRPSPSLSRATTPRPMQREWYGSRFGPSWSSSSTRNETG